MEEKQLTVVQQPERGISMFFMNMPVRAIVNEAGEIEWLAQDICDILDYGAKAETVLRKLKENEKLMRKFYASGQTREMLFVNEQGLYRLIFRSSKPEAEAFQDWVFGEVLPSIRKTGSYSMQASLIPQQVVDRIEKLETSVKNLRFAFDGYGTVWSFIHYCCQPDSARAIVTKDEAYTAYCSYCAAVQVKPECRSHFCGKVYRTVNNSYSVTVSIRGIRTPAIRGFSLLPGYHTIINDHRLAKEKSDAAELARRRRYYFGIGETDEVQA